MDEDGGAAATDIEIDDEDEDREKGLAKVLSVEDRFASRGIGELGTDTDDADKEADDNMGELAEFVRPTA